MRGVRWREDFEGQCEACGLYWPLTSQFWMRNSGLVRCRACVTERRPADPAKLEARRAYKREWMRRHRRKLQVAA